MAVELGDVFVEFDCLAQYAHHFKAGKVAVAQNTRYGRTACAFAAQHTVTVCAFGQVKSHTQANQPADGRWCIGNHLRNQFFFACVVAAFDGVVKVLLQAVFRADRRLNAAFGHYGIAVADTQLVRHNHARACFGCRQCRCCARTAAADNQHVSVQMFRARQIIVVNQGMTDQQFRQIRMAVIARVRTDGQFDARICLIVGVKLAQQFVFFRQVAAQFQ